METLSLVIHKQIMVFFGIENAPLIFQTLTFAFSTHPVKQIIRTSHSAS